MRFVKDLHRKKSVPISFLNQPANQNHSLWNFGELSTAQNPWFLADQKTQAITHLIADLGPIPWFIKLTKKLPKLWCLVEIGLFRVGEWMVKGCTKPPTWLLPLYSQIHSYSRNKSIILFTESIRNRGDTKQQPTDFFCLGSFFLVAAATQKILSLQSLGSNPKANPGRN